MEKRLILFVVLSVFIFTGYTFLRLALFPPRPGPPAAAPDRLADKDAAADPQAEDQADGKALKQEPAEADAPPPADPDAVPPESGAPEPPPPPLTDRPQQWASLGSLAPDSPYRLLVTLTNRGAAIERVELVERRGGKLRYRDLERQSGYLGLRCETVDRQCVVRLVGPGTPAAQAKPDDGTVALGLQPGDVIRTVQLASRAAEPTASRGDLAALLADSRPGQSIELTVRRTVDQQAKEIRFQATLIQAPLALIAPESPPGKPARHSFLLGLHQLGTRQVKLGEDELPALLSLRHTNWQMEQPGDDRVVFRQQLAVGDAEDRERLELVKTYQIVPTPAEAVDNHAYPSYHLRLRIELHNRGRETHELAFALDGPNGLPTEGWWYLNKISPSWGGAGARDIVWRVHEQAHSLRSPNQMFKDFKKDPQHPSRTILPDQPGLEARTLDYVGGDTQYFSAVLMAGAAGQPGTLTCRQAYAVPLDLDPELSGREIRTLNSTFRLVSETMQLEPGQSAAQDYHVFLGPKSPDLLAAYGLSSVLEYGWFGWIAKPLSHVLHFFYAFVRNYGLAIILLTVLVRGAMFPIGRKAARNAQVMQQLAPEIKAIKEKYKNDLEKQAQAQRELWKKHNFNPLGSCWLMFLQLPIFIGLYRCLSVDIELRQAPLIPGLRWCSNLAGPDMFWNWQGLGLDFVTSKSGWLGPYLNILPLVTVVLFIVQQKMFTPPATDDQTRMQQSMMKYMMIFMGFLFFKVPSGLCVYFIASSLWGIGERKFLPTQDASKEGASGKPDKEAKPVAEGKGGRRSKRAEGKPRKSILERIEQWQRLAEQKAKEREAGKSRAPDRPRRKNRKR